MKWFFPLARSAGMNLAQVGRFVRSPLVPRWKKIFGVMAVVYAVFPLDIIPDAIPLVGWLDDIGVLSLAFTLIFREIRKHEVFS